ncbi:extracellular solute-binding protein [Paenibacillus sp. GYB004]|uniref:extracellular solute-binding protein n=1 Tax=Paenibacillus sp. GYB004 TaxID=2994393 RepID=UPI002F963527
MTNGVRRTTFRERYAYLLDHIRTKISSGEWPPGQYIPAENELARLFQLSRPSVRKVLNELSEEGLIHTMHGKGSVVTEAESACTYLNLFWGVPSFEFETVSEIVSRFNQANPFVKVEITQVPRETILAATQEGSFMGRVKPDLVGLPNTMFFQIADGEPDKLLKPITLEEPDDFYEAYRRAFTHEGKLWAAPIMFAPIILAYNKTIFDRLGLSYPDETWTWDELLQASQALTEYDGGQAERYGFSFTASANRWPLFVLQNGGAFVEGRQLLPEDSRTWEALQFSADLMYKYQVSPIYSTGHAKTGEGLFLREKVGMILTSYTFMEQFRDIDFEWDFVPFPGKVADAGLGICSGIGISSHCTSVHAAEQFIRYVTSETAQADMKHRVCSIPARRSVAESRDFPHYPLAGKRYYSFQSITERAQTIKDFGLTYKQFMDLDNELGLLWANVESVQDVWRTLRGKWNVHM